MRCLIQLIRRDFFSLLIIGFAMLFLVCMVLADFCGLRVNLTASMPIGIYRVSAFDQRALHRGEIVAVCPPPAVRKLALAREYLHSGRCPGNIEPLLKHVAAIAGDRVAVRTEGVLVNGRLLPHSARRSVDEAGRILPHIADGNYTVGKGQVWLNAPVAESWDSRYYGAVPVESIESKAEGLLLYSGFN